MIKASSNENKNDAPLGLISFFGPNPSQVMTFLELLILNFLAG